ncbi:MAG: glycoside hydrolase family 5 protein [Lentisphaeria bacterium]|nr:glycoside hydrolase family 5 protein [Lentisphaeria bacterium]
MRTTATSLLILLAGTLHPGRAAVPSALSEIGVNLAGAEFGKVPGLYGKDYTYPGAAQLDTCRRKGLRIIRLPFRWERLQPTLLGELDAAELVRLDAVVELARARDLSLLLDMHNYARYGGQLIGSEAVPVPAFVDVWRRIAEHYRDNDTVAAYGLMNEPHDTKGLWPAAAQACVDGIRAVDTRHALVVCGDGWSGAHSWARINGKFLLHDPADSLLYEAHQYFDRNSSGSYRGTYDEEGAHPDIGADRLRPFLDWLQEHGARGFIGEFGVPDTDPRWLVVLDRFLAAMRRHGIGGTYWAAGPWWGTYPLSIEPRDGADRPQVAVLDWHLIPRDPRAPKPWAEAAEQAERAARERRALEQRGVRILHDFGSRKESYHYGNEGSTFDSAQTIDEGRQVRRISYRHVGDIAWVGIGIYFGSLDCSGRAAFSLEVRGEKPCRIEVKAYTTDGRRFSGLFDVGGDWQELVIPFAALTSDGVGLPAADRIEKIELQPGVDREGNALILGRFFLPPAP